MADFLLYAIAACLAYIAFSWHSELLSKTKIDLGTSISNVRMHLGQRLIVQTHVTVRTHLTRRILFGFGKVPADQITREAKALVNRTISLWALCFPSPKEAMEIRGYHHLDTLLSEIAGEGFHVEFAVVIKIDVKDGDEPEPELEPEESPVERVRKKYAEMGDTITALNESYDELAKKHPAIVLDPAIEEDLKTELIADKKDIVLNHRPLKAQRSIEKVRLDRRKRRG